MKHLLKAACLAAVAAVPGAAFAACDEGEIVVKFPYATKTKDDRFEYYVPEKLIPSFKRKKIIYFFIIVFVLQNIVKYNFNFQLWCRPTLPPYIFNF